MSFESFWAGWPNKVGRIAAQKAWNKHVTPLEEPDVHAGAERYKRGKPDWQNWMHASTFINQQRWKDEWTGQRHEHDDRPMPQYLRKKAKRPKVNGEQRELSRIRMDVFDELRRQGKNPYLMPKEEVQTLVETRQAEAARRQEVKT